MDVTATAGLVNLQYQPDRLADQCTSGLRLIEKHNIALPGSAAASFPVGYGARQSITIK
jgi:hypothetical protein